MYNPDTIGKMNDKPEVIVKKTITNQKLTIPLSDEDCQDIQMGETFDWTFVTENGESIDVHLKLEDDEDIE